MTFIARADMKGGWDLFVEEHVLHASSLSMDVNHTVTASLLFAPSDLGDSRFTSWAVEMTLNTPPSIRFPCSC